MFVENSTHFLNSILQFDSNFNLNQTIVSNVSSYESNNYYENDIFTCKYIDFSNFDTIKSFNTKPVTFCN